MRKLVQKITANEKILHSIFVCSLLLKALNAIAEIVLSLFLLSGDKIFTWLQTWAENKLLLYPNDLLAPYVLNLLSHISANTVMFLVFYLIIHGIIKLVLVIGLLRNKLYMYPIAIWVFILFIFYQIYRFTFTHSIMLVVLTLFDAFIIWLTWHEYHYLRKSRKA
jgi:uncharacterized membrane protein